MKALQITGYGDVAANLSFAETAKPSLKSNQVLIEVRAAGVNPIDYKIVEGELKQINKLDFPAPIGFDGAGVVVEVGETASGFSIGDEVYTRVPSTGPGTFAEFVAVDADAVCLKPENLDFVEAASLPLVGLTVVQSFEAAGLKPDDRVLIHAGSGGIGSFAIQYAKSKGAFVYTTTSTRNVDWVKDLGADRVIDYKTENYKEIATNLGVVYDTLGGSYTIDAFDQIQLGGRVISLTGDVDAETARELGLNGLFRLILAFKRRKLTKKIKQKSAFYKLILMKADGAQLGDIKALVEAGQIKPVMDQKSFSFSEAVDALLYQRSGRAQGKIVLNM